MVFQPLSPPSKPGCRRFGCGVCLSFLFRKLKLAQPSVGQERAGWAVQEPVLGNAVHILSIIERRHQFLKKKHA
jgi:hypothetical protein